MPVCDDLRIGGTLSASGITGGVSINNTRIAVSDWSGLFGHSGRQLQSVRINGRPGSQLIGSGLGLERFHTLNLLITRWDENGRGSLTELTLGEQLWRNTDLLLGYLDDTFLLEVDDPDGTSRFTETNAIDPAGILQTEWRRISLPLTSPWPYWRAGGAESSQAINGTATLTVGGNVSVYDAILEFSGDGTYTHNGEGWEITIAGSTSTVTVDLGARTVTQAGVDASNLMTRTHREWGWFPVGSNSITTTVSVTTKWRDQWN